MENYIRTISFIFVFIFTFQTIQAQNNEDHPLLSRFDGAEVHREQSFNYDAAQIPIGPINNDEPEEVLELEGRVSWIAYRIPEGRSALEIARNYEMAFADGGFDILFACTAQECGSNFWGYIRSSEQVFPGNIASSVVNHDHSNRRVFVARAQTDEQVSHFLLYIVPHPRGGQARMLQLSVDGEPMETGLVATGVRDAAELQEALDTEGKAIVPGIFFEFDSADIRLESHEALEQMAELMRGSADLRVHIVGHTDNQGSFEYNLGLSEQRAQAVRQALANDYEIEAERMVANGVAYLAPITSNNTEEGREQNRRVELVLQ